MSAEGESETEAKATAQPGALSRLARAARDAAARVAASERVNAALDGLSRAVLRTSVGLRRPRRPSGLIAIGLAVAGPTLALLTYTALSTSDAESDVLSAWWFRALLLADLLYILVLIGLIALEIQRLVRARRARSAGSKLHTRMAGVFAGVAAAPALLIAGFFFLVIQLGFDAWFNEQIGSVVRNSRTVAQAYAREHETAIKRETEAIASRVRAALDNLVDGARDPRFRLVLTRATEESAVADVFVIDALGEVLARGDLSFLFNYSPPSANDYLAADAGEIAIRPDRDASELRALARLEAGVYLYVTRPLDGEVLASLARTNAGVLLYSRLEENRGLWMARFAAIYLGFAALVLIAAVYLGLWFAERLSRPIARLAFAAQRVREGDLDVQVREPRGEDDLALLTRGFNRMTEEVRRKQSALTKAKEESEDRRLFSEAVLSGVSAGVVGLDDEGRVRLLNHSAAELLAVDPYTAVDRPFIELAPEFADLFADASFDPSAGVERPIRLVRGDIERELLARITSQREHGPDGHGEGAVVGYVVTVDDLTDLVSAQRLAAWGDVARRVAHEIKNPLTPIQLAAERLRRKFSKRLGEDADVFDRYVETIVRQTGDIGRMVDAFVRFAKMPTPKMAKENLESLVREAVLLQEEARTHIAFSIALEGEAAGGEAGEPLFVRADRGQLLQAFTNLLQNATDAIGARLAEDAAENREPVPPEIRVSIVRLGDRAAVRIEDNGVGLPQKERRRLLEPYVTTREKGTGLGLAIVSKIIEEHSGVFELLDARPFAQGLRHGACAQVTLPLRTEVGADAPDAAASENNALAGPAQDSGESRSETPAHAEPEAAR